MTSKLWGDIETFSPTPIKNGVHAYAEKAEVLLLTYALDDGPAMVWDVARGMPMPSDLSAAIDDTDCEVWFHNSSFDRTVLSHAMPKLVARIALERWRDTLVQALAHSLPGALGALCEILGLPIDQQKDKEGKTLIRLFCIPQRAGAKFERATPASHPVEWQRFVEYAKQDIVSMRAAHKKLPVWNYPANKTELALWHLDQQINDRGVAIDVDLVECAIEAVDAEQKVLAARTVQLTDGEVTAATQRDKMLKHMLGRYGIELPDMRASTLERRIQDPDLPIPLRELLTVRLQASTSSTSKYKTIWKAVSSDGRARGLTQFCGASRTSRAAGRLVNPLNMMRPTLPQSDIEMGVEALKARCADIIFPNVMELTANTMRGVIIAPPGKKLVVSDLSNIEGRGVAYLAGEEWKLRAFRDFDAGEGPDLYKLAYAKSFRIKPEDVTKEQRQIGKVMELALGYGGGVGAFITFAAAYGIDLEAMAAHAAEIIPKRTWDEALRAYEWAVKQKRTFELSKNAYAVCDSFKRMWREAHPNIASYWTETEDMVRRAICTPSTTFACRKTKIRRDGNWLRIGMPSGRALCYPSPRVGEDGRISYMGTNQYTRKFQRIFTYSGKLVENETQKFARDIFYDAMPAIEAAGYEICLHVYDEDITQTPDTDDFNAEALSAILAAPPPWAADIPLAAAGFSAPRYRKD